MTATETEPVRLMRPKLDAGTDKPEGEHFRP